MRTSLFALTVLLATSMWLVIQEQAKARFERLHEPGPPLIEISDGATMAGVVLASLTTNDERLFRRAFEGMQDAAAERFSAIQAAADWKTAQIQSLRLDMPDEGHSPGTLTVEVLVEEEPAIVSLGGISGGPRGLVSGDPSSFDVAFPRRGKWQVPVTIRCEMTQGHGGSFSHHSEQSRYSWDFAIPEGTPVVASRSGLVTYANLFSNIGGPTPEYADDGNAVVIQHEDGLTSIYAHLAKRPEVVRAGDYVLQGELIGYSGNTGYSRGPHLHYGVHRLGKSVRSGFADFSRHLGIPREGDWVEPAKSPAVPQDVISAYRRVWRGVVHADGAGVPDLALRAYEDLPSEVYPDYIYHRRLEWRRESLLETVRTEVTRLIATDLPTGSEWLAMERLSWSLNEVAELRGGSSLRDDLARRLAERGSVAIEGAHDAWRYYSDAVALEARSDFLGSMKAWARARRVAPARMVEEVDRRMRDLADRYWAVTSRVLGRLLEESVLASDEYEEFIVRADIDRVTLQAREFFKIFGRATTAGRARARQAVRELTDARRKMLRNLDSHQRNG